ncbi:MAG: alkaline phosphatase family protein [Acidimicrobiia bacterium]|nr:alkaline phosphatase family protein [Acidimicrobiia bacterium]
MDPTSVAASPEEPVHPAYDGACISNIVPALLEWDDRPRWLPEPVREADQVVLLVLDGLGWDQLAEREACAPTLASFAGGPATTVAPSTTATALTSIATGLAPGEHGIVGYRIMVEGEVLNVLRWNTVQGDGRARHRPALLQPNAAFAGHRPPVVTKADFVDTGFTQAHLEATRFTGYRQPSTLVTHVAAHARRGEPFIYAYYEGIDKVAHEYGLSEYYDAELRAADQIVANLMAALPSGVALLVTADHGQVHTGDDVVAPHRDVLAHVAQQSGEARFRWLHARSGRAGALHEACEAHHGEQAWVFTRDELVDGGWFGPKVTDEARARLGDVALAAKGTIAFSDPADSGPYVLVGRHGSLTSAEMRVPLLGAVV